MTTETKEATMRTIGTVEVIRHGQGWTLNFWAINEFGAVRFLRPVTILESEGGDVRDELVRVARREFGEGVLRKSAREFLPTSIVAVYEVTR
jgi:hypothetical protein